MSQTTGYDPPPPPPPGALVHPAEPEQRRTRKPMALWDRIKFLVIGIVLFAVFVWADLAQEPLLTLEDAFERQLENKWWLPALVTLELLRQIHYLLSERFAGWHAFWMEGVFGGANRKLGRLTDWNRYRLGRGLKIAALIVAFDLVLAAFFDLSPALALVQAPGILWSLLPFALQIGFYFFIIVFQFMGIFWFLSRGGVDVYMPEDIQTRFSDVWGQDNVVDRVKENMVFLEDPESIEAKGGYVPGGVLLWGPPGTGKTLMAEAVAGETGKPFVFVDPGAFINMFMGVGILKVKSLFRKLRKLAVRYGGVIVFFDEADSLGNRGAIAQGGWGGQGGWSAPASGAWSHAAACNGLGYLSQDTASLLFRAALDQSTGDEPSRRWRDRIIMGGGMGGGGMGTLQALLTELSGLKKPRGFMNRYVRRLLGMRPKPPPKYRILVMMATNMPQALDEALLRPGRIDRIYKVGYPSKVGRIRTYKGYFDKVAHSLSEDELDRLATITPYATGATIKDLVNESLINAIRNGREVITWADVVKAKQLKDLGPPEDVEYIERERHAVAVHEACHAVLAYRVRKHLTIDIATIEKGGTYLGMVASIPPEDQFTRWRTEYEADIMVSLASLAGERMFFDGDNSSGVSGDLESATMIATLMEGYWGMGQTVASHGVTHRVGIGGGGKPGSEGTDDKKLLEGTLGARIETSLEEILSRAERMLGENRLQVLAVAHALETHKTLTGEDVEAIIDGRPGPLIDGRVYHGPDFMRIAEEYHARALTAHKMHSTVAAPLPVFAAASYHNGPTGEVDGDSDGDGVHAPAEVGEGADGGD